MSEKPKVPTAAEDIYGRAAKLNIVVVCKPTAGWRSAPA